MAEASVPASVLGVQTVTMVMVLDHILSRMPLLLYSFNKGDLNSVRILVTASAIYDHALGVDLLPLSRRTLASSLCISPAYRPWSPRVARDSAQITPHRFSKSHTASRDGFSRRPPIS